MAGPFCWLYFKHVGGNIAGFMGVKNISIFMQSLHELIHIVKIGHFIAKFCKI